MYTFDMIYLQYFKYIETVIKLWYLELFQLNDEIHIYAVFLVGMHSVKSHENVLISVV